MDSRLAEKIGVCQWFHYQDKQAVLKNIELLRELGIRHLRTGVSWADYHRENGRRWYDWQMQTLAEAGLDILLSVWHTPPSISRGGTCSSPPRRLNDYADFIALLLKDYGNFFSSLELWNEPNNVIKWNFADYDPEWRLFAEMIKKASCWAKESNCHTVLGGMIPVDHHWLELIRSYGGLRYIDTVGVHAFPGMWWEDHPNWEWHSHWHGWDKKIAYISDYLEEGQDLWVTETGFATWDQTMSRTDFHNAQVQRLADALRAPVPRTYWYCGTDLHPFRMCIEMSEAGRIDHHEYHLGLVTSNGTRKPAFHFLKHVLENNKVPCFPLDTLESD